MFVVACCHVAQHGALYRGPKNLLLSADLDGSRSGNVTGGTFACCGVGLGVAVELRMAAIVITWQSRT